MDAALSNIRKNDFDAVISEATALHDLQGFLNPARSTLPVAYPI